MTSECRNTCGLLIHEIPADAPHKQNCFHCGSDITRRLEICAICGEQSPNFATDADGTYRCKDCNIYRKRRGFERSAEVIANYEGVSSPRSHPHFHCGWRMKFVMMTNNMNVWRVQSFHRNDTFHVSQPLQYDRRLTLLERDEVDKSRVVHHRTAAQMKTSTNISDTFYLKDDTEPTATYHPLQKFKDRVRTIDQHRVRDSITVAMDPVMRSSDWYKTERLLLSNLENVLLFQRGDSSLNRDYHIIVSHPDLLHSLSVYGNDVVGIDTTYDYTAVRFAFTILTFADGINKGKIAAISICSSDSSSTYNTFLRFVRINVPCSSPQCAHDRRSRKLDDGNGLFTYLECSENPLSSSSTFSAVMHDKDAAILRAVRMNGLSSVLCSFHTLQALMKFISSKADLAVLIRPIIMAFKVVMRSWNDNVRNSLSVLVVQYIQGLPLQLLSEPNKQVLIYYLRRFWLDNDCIWSRTFSAECLYSCPEASGRYNPLFRTNNITERKFSLIQYTYMNGFGSQMVNNLLGICLQKVLGSEVADLSYLAQSNQNNYPRQRTISSHSSSSVNNRIRRALKLREDGHITYFDVDSGWALVFSEYVPVEASDDFYTTCNAEGNELFDEERRNVHDASVLDELINSIRRDLDYVPNYQKAIQYLDSSARNIFYRFVVDQLPEGVQNMMRDGHHVCNLKLSICTCAFFILNGQPHFCKHVLAELYDFGR